MLQGGARCVVSCGEMEPRGDEATAGSSDVPATRHEQVRAGAPACRIYDINEHLLCALCSGYLVDATAISECLHTCQSFTDGPTCLLYPVYTMKLARRAGSTSARRASFIV